jgi:hypothetical protein
MRLACGQATIVRAYIADRRWARPPESISKLAVPDQRAPIQVSLTLIDDLATRSESPPRALNVLRDRGLIWRACLAFCFAFWMAVAFGIYALVS